MDLTRAIRARSGFASNESRLVIGKCVMINHRLRSDDSCYRNRNASGLRKFPINSIRAHHTGTSSRTPPIMNTHFFQLSTTLARVEVTPSRIQIPPKFARPRRELGLCVTVRRSEFALISSIITRVRKNTVLYSFIRSYTDQPISSLAKTT